MTDRDARAVVSVLGPQLRQEVATTVRVLRVLPETGRTWRPDPVSRTAWDLAVHLCRSEEWFLTGLVTGDFAPGPQEAPADTFAALLAWYTTVVPPQLEHVLALDAAVLASSVDFYGTPMPRVALLPLFIGHSAHHRGQLSSALRSMGARVPSIYGSSADQSWRAV
jgi:uncharacterized damage-inducible protein DinB